LSDHLHSPDEADEYWFDEGCFILELMNSSSDESCSIARARIPAGGSTRPHTLRQTVERYVILEGSGLVEIDGLLPQAVSRYDVVQIPPGISQKITNTGAGELIFLCICTPRFQQACYVDLN